MKLDKTKVTLLLSGLVHVLGVLGYLPTVTPPPNVVCPPAVVAPAP